MTDAPEKIWADARTCSVYMDGSSPITARTREFRNSTEYTRSDLVAELAAENERLRFAYNSITSVAKTAYERAEKAEALSRTGAVKVKALPRPDAVSMTCGTICLEYADYDLRDDAYDWLEQHASSSDDALEPSAPEGQQPVAGAVRVCPVRDAICPHGIGCLYNNGMDCDMEASRADLAYQKHAASYTRPSEQAVTEAAMSEAEEMFADYFRRNYPGPDTIIGKPDWHSPKIFRAALHALRSIGALKAAMEAGQ